jgi:hypothetical protein
MTNGASGRYVTNNTDSKNIRILTGLALSGWWDRYGYRHWRWWRRCW